MKQIVHIISCRTLEALTGYQDKLYVEQTHIDNPHIAYKLYEIKKEIIQIQIDANA